MTPYFRTSVPIYAMPQLLYDMLTKPRLVTPHVIGRGILPIKGKMIVAGDPKANKSWIGLNMAIGLARGRVPFNALYKVDQEVFPVYKTNTVLYMEQEMGEAGLQDRFLGGLLPEQESVGLPFYLQTRDVRYKFDNPEGQALIEEAIASCKPDVVFFDTFVKFHDSDENSAQEMSRVLRFGDAMIEKYGCSLVYLHHTTRVPQDPNMTPRRGGNRLRGSTAIFGDVDTVMLVDRLSPEDHPEPTIQLSFELRRGEPLLKQTVKRLKTGQVIYLGQGTEGKAAANRT